jgi:hypothetical protein
VPDVPVALWVITRGTRFLEERVLVRGVVNHVIADDLDVAFVRLLDQTVEVRERAELRINILVVANVVAEINLRRRIERCNPNRIYAEVLQVVQLRRDAVQVADAVAVRIVETTRVNFLINGALPPVGSILLRHSFIWARLLRILLWKYSGKGGQ